MVCLENLKKKLIIRTQVMEHQNESETIDNKLKEEEECSISEDRLRSSSSSVSSASDIESAITDFSVEDHPCQIDRIEHGNFVVDQEDGVVETRRLGGDATALESPPPVQIMERPVSPSGYRIPSYVFARDKSTPNPDWSTASNESLFSIHTGNMSFTRDQFNWLLRSGELSGNLGLSSGDVPKSGELPPLSPRYVQKPTTPKHVDPHDNNKEEEEEEPVNMVSMQETPKAGEEIIAAHFKTSLVAPPSPSPSPQKQGDEDHNGGSVDQPNEDSEPVELVTGLVKKDQSGSSEIRKKRSSASTASDDVPLKNCTSHHSDASGQSFAFPVLAEIGREKSVNSGQSHIRPDLRKDSLAIDQDESNSPKPKTEPTPASNSWFSSCFCCCCSCC